MPARRGHFSRSTMGIKGMRLNPSCRWLVCLSRHTGPTGPVSRCRLKPNVNSPPGHRPICPGGLRVDTQALPFFRSTLWQDQTGIAREQSRPQKSVSPLHRPSAGSAVLASWTLLTREAVRFFRQRNRVIGAVATPLMFWLLLGCGLDRSFRLIQQPPGGLDTGAVASDAIGYRAYFYPGTILLVVLFTAIFSTISVIEDRKEGFLQAVLVAPVRPISIVMGKVFGGAGIATVQAIFFLPVGLAADRAVARLVGDGRGRRCAVRDVGLSYRNQPLSGLADGLNCRISCRHESLAHAHVVLIRGGLSG